MTSRSGSSSPFCSSSSSGVSSSSFVFFSAMVLASPPSARSKPWRFRQESGLWLDKWSGSGAYTEDIGRRPGLVGRLHLLHGGENEIERKDEAWACRGPCARRRCVDGIRRNCDRCKREWEPGSESRNRIAAN